MDDTIPTLEDELDLALHDLAGQVDHINALLSQLNARGAA